jgi:hypothetical protein
MQEDAVVAWFQVLSQYLPGGTRQTKENFNYNKLLSDWDLNPWYSEYEAGAFHFSEKLVMFVVLTNNYGRVTGTQTNACINSEHVSA